MAVILEVSALNKYVRSLLESDPFLNDIAIRGEISNFNRNFKTGHCYFSLIDSKSNVKAVMFKAEADRISFRPENGMMVVARGRVTLYERDGAYQIYVDALFPEGAGAQKNAFDELKEKLFNEGLFNDSTKKTLPAMPWNVGAITSKTGAALQDIINVVQRRNPSVQLVLAPVAVQGKGAAEEITAAVKKMDTLGLDVVLIARGGGSAEDLAAFNSEALVRAVFAACTPVVSAVGHEIDFTLLDFVADRRAPTPSAAAEIALPDILTFLKEKQILCMNYGKNIHNRVHLCYNQMQGARRHPAYGLAARRCEDEQVRLRTLQRDIQRIVNEKMLFAENELQKATHLAGSLNPYGVLQRGYAVVTKQGQAVTMVAGLKMDDAIEVTLCDGQLLAEVKKVSVRDGGAAR